MVVALVAGVSMGAYFWTRSQIRTFEDVPPSSPVAGSSSSPAPDYTGRCARTSCNYLLLGSDSRQGLTPEEQVQFGTNADIGGENRSDTIIVVHTEPGERQATFLMRNGPELRAPANDEVLGGEKELRELDVGDNDVLGADYSASRDGSPGQKLPVLRESISKFLCLS